MFPLHSDTVLLKVRPLKSGFGGIAVLSLNRPDRANAWTAEMVDALVAQLENLRKADCRLLVLQGIGKHFCAGADLQWMEASSKLSPIENQNEAEKLFRVFKGIYDLPFPTLALVKGSAYGGGLGLVAACDVALASDSARFCVPELKWGMVSSVFFPYLAQKLRPADFLRVGLGARVTNAREALRIGLVQDVVPDSQFNDAVRDEINSYLHCEPAAQRRFKRDLREFCESPKDFWKTFPVSAPKILGEMRVSPTAQKGIGSFYSKVPPDWSVKLDVSVEELLSP